jgi:Flp pilus assembly protein TadD
MRLKRECLAMLGSALALCLAAPAFAATQEVDESALDALDDDTKKAMPKIEPAGAVELRDAIRRIALRPTDVYALTDAGYASLKLGDADAAFNFFTRAGNLQPSDPRIRAGLAAAMVRRENPFEALKLFDEAARLGANERSFAMDRAIAYDLLGNFDRAQQDYQNARSYAQSDELTRRQAVSLSLLGKAADADAMLYPLLQRDDPEAWRARSFMLAARGEVKDAEKIALSFLSVAEARRMEFYFRQMPRLTPAQQAAALHFGHFPLGSNIGQDSEQLRIAAASTGVKPRPTTGEGRLIPSGQPLGGKTVKRADTKKPRDRNSPASDVRTARRDGAMTTQSAQNTIDRVGTTAPRVIAAAQLPVPEAARPLVRIVLPAAKPAPPPVVASLPPPKPPAPVIVATSQTAVAPKPIALPETRPAAVQPSKLPPSAVTIATANPPRVEELPAIGQAVVPDLVKPPLVTPSVNSAPIARVTFPNDPVAAPVASAVAPKAETPPPAAENIKPPFAGEAPRLSENAVAPPSVGASIPAAVSTPSPAPMSAPSSTPPMTTAPTSVATQIPESVKIATAEPGFSVLEKPASALPTVDSAVPNLPPVVPAATSVPVVIEAGEVGTMPQGPNADGSVVAVSTPAVAEVQTAKPAIVFQSSTPAATQSPSPAAPVETAPAALDLGSVIDSIAIPETEQVRNVAPVDLKKIKPAPLKAEEPAKTESPKSAKHTPRFWVQLATGADLKGLGFDYQRFAKKSPALFNGVGGHTAVWNKSRRLLAGPFPDMKAAKKWEAEFRKNGGNGFVWLSSGGEVVDPLKGK